jgi:hypothetical protein
LNQDPVVAFVWSTALFLQRAIGWRLMEWPFRKVRVLILQDPSLGDEDLAELEHLGEFDAIDLEGTQITDAGLAPLETLKQLRFLVLRRTQVTSAGVARLQGKLRKAWIWH